MVMTTRTTTPHQPTKQQTATKPDGQAMTRRVPVSNRTDNKIINSSRFLSSAWTRMYPQVGFVLPHPSTTIAVVVDHEPSLTFMFCRVYKECQSMRHFLNSILLISSLSYYYSICSKSQYNRITTMATNESFHNSSFNGITSLYHRTINSCQEY